MGPGAATLALLCAMMLCRVGPAFAHEPAMGVLDLREVRPGVLIGGWTLEPTIGAENVRVRFPPHCVWRPPTLECGAKGLVGPIGVDNLGRNMSAVLVRVRPLDGGERAYTLTSAKPVASVLGSGQPRLETWVDLGRTYFDLGVEHILLGLDHLLFVLGLIWLVRGGWRLAKTITAFTVGHSISLALAAFGVIGVPEKPLNACIALSIVFVGVEMVKERQGEPGLTARYPWAVSLGFGLVHGIGFASALANLGIERRLLPVALLSFNVGVEAGQLAFVLLVLLLIAAHRRLGAVLPRWGELVPGYAIGTIAAFWSIGRLARLLAVPA